jgi:abequosyltransferase
MSVILSIVVPTFNRAASLKRLLDALAVELDGLQDRICVIVGDNASTDATPEVTAAFALGRPGVRLLRHATNVGPEENFCLCLEQVDSPYFWIIGDDDLPRAGAVQAVLELIVRLEPDLMYLESSWHADVLDRGPENPVRQPSYRVLSRDQFARRVHVWATFISGMVVSRAALARAETPATALRHCTGTSLVQLGWVLERLRNGTRFVHITVPCVLATSGNTGGYRLLKVFGENFPRIVRLTLQPALAQSIITRCTLMFLPGLVWGLRFGRLGSFEAESAAAALSQQLGNSWTFNLVLRPIGHAPRPVARAALAAAHAGSRLLRTLDRLHERLSRQGGRA